MTVRVAVAAVLILVLVAPGCGPDATNPSTSITAAPTGGPPTAVAESLARYTRTGGLGGRRFEVVVRHDGTFEGGSGKPGRGHLGGDSLGELRRLVAEFESAKPEDRYGEVNSDVFATTVVAGDTSTTVVTGGEPPRAVRALISFLAALERQLPK